VAALARSKLINGSPIRSRYVLTTVPNIYGDHCAWGGGKSPLPFKSRFGPEASPPNTNRDFE